MFSFFQARSKEPLELAHVKHKYNSLTFSIEHAGDTCITLLIKDDLSVMKIELLSRCSLSGKESITIALEFARAHFIQTVELVDDSDIFYEVSNKFKKISLKELSLLETGYTWYETFGFRNEFEQCRDHWIECIRQPCSVLPFEYNTTPDTPIHVMCSQLHFSLKERGNKCTLSEDEFMEISTCLKKTFQWVLHEVEVHYKQKMNLDHYSLPLYFSNETWVHSEGSIGKVVGIQPGYYRIEFSNGVKEVPIPHVKRLQKVLYRGDKPMKVKIVDWDKEGYLVEWNDTKIVVPFEKIKIIGGRKTKRRVWTNQSLRSGRNR
jgi:hypothetical protein